MQIKEMFKNAKASCKTLNNITDDQRNNILLAVADAIVANSTTLLEENAKDLAKMDRSNPLYDRLQLTEKRLEDIAADMRHVATLPTPLGHITNKRTLDNGLRLCRISVPFGVIGVIYEARPNVTFDVFSLCFKSGNACVLKGGSDADNSNQAAIKLIHKVLRDNAIDENVVTLLPATHEATGEMLGAVGYIDVCIPRGGRRLIDFVRDNARIPVIETGAGVVHVYFDKDGDLEMGKAIVNNSKTRRVSVCNALDTLLVHKERLGDLPELLAPMKDRVTFYMNEEERYDTEFMDYKMNVVIVASLDKALEHIARHGSGHSESIITENVEAARRFQREVDAACVYWNVPTSFTDGAQFGLGAEIGISTQKLGPRGPMGLEEMTTYKWIIEGDGQVREK
jgi:glutamate-5-semialdehyde dehydrogenase